MKKKLFIALVILLMTGCKVEYKLDINKDLTVTETVNMTGTDNFFAMYNRSSKLNIVNMMLETTRANEVLGESGYNIQVISEETPYVLASKKFSSINEYADNNMFYSQYFEKINYKKTNNIIEISSEGFKPNDPQDPNRFDIKDFSLAITCPYNVTENNASSVDEKTNTYYWKITDKTDDFNFLLKFDSSKEYNYQLKIIMRVLFYTLCIVVVWIVYIFYKKKQK